MRQENSLQTAARWAGYSILGLILFGLFAYTVGTIVWLFKCFQVRKYPRKYRKMLRQYDVYTCPEMGFAYLLAIVPALILAAFVLSILVFRVGYPFDKWWFHDIWGEPWNPAVN